MKEYIEKLYNLETELIQYSITKNIIEEEIEDIKDDISILKKENIDMSQEIKLNLIKEIPSEYNVEPPTKPIIYEQDDLNKQIFEIVLLILGIILLILSINTYRMYETLPKILIYIIIIYFSVPIIMFLSDKNIKKVRQELYTKKLIDYNNELKQYEKDKENFYQVQKDFIKSKEKELEEKNNLQKEIFNKKIEVYNNYLKELRSIKKENSRLETNTINKIKRLYEKNIIFNKYRNIAALSSFYEYFASGRVNTLEGPNGAYNLYETEVMAKQAKSNIKISYDIIEYYEEDDFQYFLKDALYKIKDYVKTQEQIIIEKTINTRIKINELNK